MAGDGIFISDRPQLAIARETTSFPSLGLSDPNLVRIIYKIGNPFLSYIPSEDFNSINGIEEGASYLLYVNNYYDGSPALVNAVLDNLIPQTTTNVFAGQRTVFICTTSVDFATAGITTLNTNLITLVNEGYFTSYDPNDTQNGIDGFVEGFIYYIDPILDIDLSAYGVTEVRYADEVLYLNDLEDVVLTNPNPDAALPLEGEEILVRNPTTGVWENQSYDPGVPGSDIPDGLISGGKVIWEGGLTFRVTAAVYYIGGVRYESAEGTITLDAADATNPRFDIIALNDSEAIVKITGTPSANPSEPQVDFSSQLYLTAVLVEAGATTPSGVSQGIIYDENTEWSHSTSGTISTDFASTAQHSNGSVSLQVASWSNGASVLFTNGSAINVNEAETFSFKILITAALSKSNTLTVQFFNGTTAASSQIPLIIYRNTPGTFQAYAVDGIPFAGSSFDRVKFTFGGNSSTAIYIDEVRYQSGVTQPTNETDPTVHPLIKQIPTSPDASTNKYLNWNGSGYVRKQVDYSEISGTPPGGSSYTDEEAQDAVGSILADSDTIDFTYNDATPSVSADVKKQMSIDSDSSGLKLSGDSASPGNSKYYGTDGVGAKGFHDFPSGSDTNIYNTDGTLIGNRTITGAGNYLAISGARVELSKGANVASANDLTLGSDGNTFLITGTTQINAITTTNWQAGSFVLLLFGGSITVKHNTSGGAGTAKIFLSNSIDFSAVSNDVLLLFYDGTQWQEVARKNSGTSGGIDDVLAKAQNFTANRTINSASFGLTISATGATTPLAITAIAATALTVSTSSGLPALFVKNPSSTNTVEDMLTLRRQTSGAAGGNGIGGRLRFQLERSGSSAADAGSLDWVFDDASATPHSSLRFNTNDTQVGNYSGRQVNTTDATPTTLQTHAITDETAGMLEVFLVGKSTGTAGKITGKKIVGYRKDGGTLTLDSLTTILADVVTGDLTTATWTITTSSNNIIVQVTGQAAKTINWKCVINQIDL